MNKVYIVHVCFEAPTYGWVGGGDIHLLMEIVAADSNCMFDPCNKSTSISCCCCVTSLLIYPAAAAVLTHNAPRPLNPFFWVDCSYFSSGVMALLRPLLLLLLCFVLPSSKSIKCFTCIGPVRFQFDKFSCPGLFSPVHLPQAPHLPEHPG